MEKCGFQSELLSVLEALARAAVAEINRRVEDSCAVLRLEVSRGRRDIELLKGKCELMEAELRRSRLRARRRVVYSPAPPLVRVVLQSTGTAGQMEAEVPCQQQPQQQQQQQQQQQCDDAEVSNQAEHVQIKEECSEEDEWRSEAAGKDILAAAPCFKASPPAPPQIDGFLDSCFQSAETSAEPLDPLGVGPAPELLVKREQEDGPDENATPQEAGLGSVPAEGDHQMWLSGLRRDAAESNLAYAGPPIPAVFVSQNGLCREDAAARIQPSVRSHAVAMANAARVKRRARTFGFRRAQAEEAAHAAAVSQPRPSDPGAAPQPLRVFAPRHEEAATAANPPLAGRGGGAGGAGGGSGGFLVPRRMRTPWRSGLGEKRFSCSYCDKTFMRFSQLKEHLRSHTGEKPFSCLQCGRSFTKHCNLVRHAVVHSGEKPYECALCGKCFTQRSSLKSHQKTAH